MRQLCIKTILLYFLNFSQNLNYILQFINMLTRGLTKINPVIQKVVWFSSDRVLEALIKPLRLGKKKDVCDIKQQIK